MIRIGLVDLDTSHPPAFTRILRGTPGVEVRALWDGHDVWPAGYDREFAKEHGIPVVCAHLEEMPEHVDAAMIHGTNWDTHCEKALVFLRERKPVLIDKPVVGTVRDCDRIMNMQEKYGVPVYGGSSLRSAQEVVALRTAVGPRDGLSSIVASGPGDFFSYGIHTTEMLQGCAGTGIRSVRALPGHRVPVFALTYDDGLVALVHLEMQYHEWSLVAYTGDGMHAATINPDTLYEPFLKRFVTLLEGGTIDYSLAGPVEAVRVHIAAKIARESGREVMLDRLPPDAGFDGGAFAAEYAAMKRRQAATLPQRS
jgi:hypothetical protein